MTAGAPREVVIPHVPAPLAGLLWLPPGARWLYVLGHGAGAGMRHAFMADVAAALAARGVATLRWEMAARTAWRGRPDPAAVVVEEVRAAIAAARALAPGLRLCAGGKSMGGRMTTTALAARAEPDVEAVVLLGFPLHPANQPATTRAVHLPQVEAPMLFVQGTRDALADLTLLRPIVASLGPRATIHEIDGADHGFAVLRRSGRTDAEVLEEIARTVTDWLVVR